MSLLPHDLSSFLWGMAVGGIGIVLSGFGTAAGADLWKWTKKRLSSEPPEPKEVSVKFSPTLYQPGDCAWVPELDAPNKEGKDWVYYPHPETNGRCFRMASHGGRLTKEFLMVSPEASSGSIT